MTYEAYVELERASTSKHEYVNGRVYAMAGGSPAHARLAQAIGAELRVATVHLTRLGVMLEVDAIYANPLA